MCVQLLHPSGSSTPVDGARSVSPMLIQIKSAILGSQGSLLPPQAVFSLVKIEVFCSLWFIRMVDKNITFFKYVLDLL